MQSNASTFITAQNQDVQSGALPLYSLNIGVQNKYVQVSTKRGCGVCHVDPFTDRGKMNQLVKLISVCLIPVIIMVVQNAVILSSDSTEVELKLSIRDSILFSITIATVVHTTQIERGTTLLYLSSGEDQDVHRQLQQSYRATDAALLGLTKWPSVSHPEHLRSRDAFHQSIKHFRAVLNSTASIGEVLDFYTDNNEVIISWMSDGIWYSQGSGLWRTMVGYHMLVMSKEQAGLERALGGTFYARGGFSQEDLLCYMDKRIKAEAHLDRCRQYAPYVIVTFEEAYRESSLKQTLTRMRNEIRENNVANASVQMGTWWFNNMTEYLNILRKLESFLANEIVDSLEKEVIDLERTLVVSVIIMVVTIALFPIIVIWVYKLTTAIQLVARSLQVQTVELEKERKRTETLLHEMLPVTVARSLLNNEVVPPESFESVTVFFSDIVSFTTLASRCSPLEVVTMLNQVYEAFDDRLDLYDVYKVETIGDGYMVASGLPQRNADRHASEIAGLSLDVLETISSLRIASHPEERIQLRIGINSGSAVAGIVGYKMPRYCLFGDTVNTASRMESSSLPMKIQITLPTKDILDNHGGFTTDDRGLVSIKGKGMMQTYWLTGRTSGSARREAIDLTKTAWSSI